MEPELPDLPNVSTTQGIVDRSLQLAESWLKAERERIEEVRMPSDYEPAAAELSRYLHTAIKDYARSYGLQCYRMGVEAERERCAALAQSLRDLLVRIKVNGGLGEYKGGPAFAVQNAMDALAAIRGTDTE